MNSDLITLAKTAISFIENHRQIDEWLGSVVWVATTPDKKAFADQMKQIEKLRKEGKRIQKSLEARVKKLKL